MSQFPINLDLKVSGQSKLQRAITSVKQLEQNLSRIKALDLTKAMGGPTGDKIATLVSRFKGYANNLERTNKTQITTIAQAEALQATFKELSANVKVGSGAFMLFNKAAEEQGQVVKKLKNEYENLVRASKGMQTVEQREAQLARREELIKKLKKQRLEKEKETAARERNAKAAEREARAQQKLNEKLEREKKLAAEKRKQQRGRAIGDLAASIGFPLLFGGGVGSVAGGAIGSLVGSAAGIGFGGQILGSALGQALDQAAQAANEFATTVTSAASSVDQLINAVGVRRTGTAASAQFAQTLGIGGVARASLQNELADIVGDKGVKSLEALADSSAEAANSVSQFGAKITASFAPALTAINKTISAVLGGSPAVQRLKQKEKDLAGLKEAGSQGFAIKRLEAEIAQLRRDSSEELARHAELQKAIKQVMDGMVGLEEQALGLEQSRLTARRDSLAFAQGNLAVSRLEEQLLVVQLELDGEITDQRKQQLELQERILGVQIETAKAARDNAAELARQQIQKEQISGAVKQIGMSQQEQNMQLKFKQMQEGRFKFFDEEAKSLEDRLNVTEMTLDLEQKRDLIGVNEAEKIASINRDYELRRRLAKEQYYLDLQSLEQAKAAYDLSRLQVQQQLKLRNLQAKISADQQIRQTSPFARETELLDPFFGGSRQLEIDQAVAYNDQLRLMGQQLENVVAQQQIFALHPDVRQGLKDQENSIRDQIAYFKEYQPAIDEAALAQSRFNEAMAITVPVTDAVFENLLAVVEGTKTAEQAFADFLRSIASMLFDAAKQMIATYMAIAVARIFAGMGGVTDNAGSSLKTITEKYGTFGAEGAANAAKALPSLSPKALGGPVGAGQPYLVGERGPELFVPGAQGNIVPNNAMGGSNIVVNVDASGSSVEGDSDRASQLGKLLGVAVQQELVKQKRPGGLLAS